MWGLGDGFNDTPSFSLSLCWNLGDNSRLPSFELPHLPMPFFFFCHQVRSHHLLQVSFQLDGGLIWTISPVWHLLRTSSPTSSIFFSVTKKCKIVQTHIPRLSRTEKKTRKHQLFSDRETKQIYPIPSQPPIFFRPDSSWFQISLSRPLQPPT